MHKNSYLKMKWFKETYLNTEDMLKILDVGSLVKGANYNYSNIFNEKNWKYMGLDFEDGNNVDIVVNDIYKWNELKDNSYDVVISGQFFEHLEFFWKTLNQIDRVLKPGGYLCIIVPSEGPKHGGNLPNCYIFREDGLKAMAKHIDFEVLHTSVDDRKEAKPWCDACLVAQKKNFILNENRDNLEVKLDELEIKMNLFLQTNRN